MSYALARQFQGPSGVECCVAASIFSDDEVNLVVGKTSLLQIYRIVEQETFSASLPRLPLQLKPQQRARLELVLERRLFGNIESIKAVRLVKHARDSLVLSFRDAKESLAL